MEVNKVLHAVCFTPNPSGGFGLPSLFWGAPGVAKSGIIEAFAEAWSMPAFVLSPAEHGDGAFGVVPVPVGGKTADSMRLCFPRPAWMDQFESEDGDAPRGVLFVDELNRPASRHLFGPMLAMIHARRVAGSKLPQGVRVIGAANPPSIGGMELDTALANRMGHFQWGFPDKKEWNAYLLSRRSAFTGSTGGAASEEARVMGQWSSAYAQAAALVTLFTDRKSDQWHSMPEQDNPQASGAWPSLRTWDLATHALAGAQVHGFDEGDAAMFVASFIGEAATKELFVFKHSLSLPQPEAVLDGAVQWAHNPARLDITFAVLSSCAGLVASPAHAKHTQHGARVKALWKLLGGIVKQAPDIAWDSAQVCVRAKLSGGEFTTESTPVLASLMPLHQMAKGV